MYVHGSRTLSLSTAERSAAPNTVLLSDSGGAHDFGLASSTLKPAETAPWITARSATCLPQQARAEAALQRICMCWGIILWSLLTGLERSR